MSNRTYERIKKISDTLPLSTFNQWFCWWHWWCGSNDDDETMATLTMTTVMRMMRMKGGFAFNQWQGATYQMTALGRPIHLLCSRLTKDFSFNINIIIVIINIIIWAWSTISFMMTGPQEVKVACFCFSIFYTICCTFVFFCFSFLLLVSWFFCL